MGCILRSSQELQEVREELAPATLQPLKEPIHVLPKCPGSKTQRNPGFVVCLFTRAQ